MLTKNRIHRICSELANSTKLDMLMYIAECGKASIDDIKSDLKVSPDITLQYIQSLESAGIIYKSSTSKGELYAVGEINLHINPQILIQANKIQNLVEFLENKYSCPGLIEKLFKLWKSYKSGKTTLRGISSALGIEHVELLHLLEELEIYSK